MHAPLATGFAPALVDGSELSPDFPLLLRGSLHPGDIRHSDTHHHVENPARELHLHALSCQGTKQAPSLSKRQVEDHADRQGCLDGDVPSQEVCALMGQPGLTGCRTQDQR